MQILSCQLLFQVAHQSRYIQGYRVFYRTIGSPWLVQDVEAASDHSLTLADLHGSTEYEVKIRPYFNELQGHDSLMVVLRTPEEGEKCLSVIRLSNAKTCTIVLKKCVQIKVIFLQVNV